ncbi:MAG: hypothetical protein VKP72_10200 [bacterium]|nr:hypothetical protein [bacterium]
MRRFLARSFTTFGLFLGPVESAWASGAVVTDDATTGEACTAQVESWVQVQQGANTFWSMPAVVVAPGLEVAAGYRRDLVLGGDAGDSLLVQVKKLLVPLEADGWGVGVAGGSWLVTADPARFAGGYAYVPVSQSFAGDRLRLHENLGWIHDPARSVADALTWAIAGIWMPDERLEWDLETFGDTGSPASTQLAFRMWPVPGHVQFDVMVGGDVTGAVWAIGGLNLYTAPWSSSP